jgi:hypothetical protein
MTIFIKIEILTDSETISEFQTGRRI